MSTVVTRFPPEPNGYLHLGHLKAMTFDFGYDPNCSCVLRMDDTNPKTEKLEYVASIIEDVEWLGFKPAKITYTSDYFDELFKFAVKLIEMDCAYVDLTPPDRIKEMRASGTESEYRSYPMVWHLAEFNKMANGFYHENDAVLRLKINMVDVNHALRDPIAYRIIYGSHYRTGDKWCIYPTYDYSHGIVDSIEGITHSYCSMEFYIRRDQYYWPVNKLGLKPAVVQEFGRLNVEDNFLSKRKIINYVNQNLVSGFDDPRLLTIRGLRKRGFTPEILRSIISHCSMERHDTNLTKALIDFHLREVLDRESPRMFAIIDPLEVVIEDETNVHDCNHPNHPKNVTMGSHITQLTKNILIEKSDFREVDSKDFFRLAPEKTIRLKYSYFVKYANHNKDIVTVSKTEPTNPKKIKGVIHWISKDFAIPVKFELYDKLLIDGEYNPNSKIIRDGYVEPAVMENLSKPYQFERLGYFKFDRYDNGKPVFIRVIDLIDKFNN
ncbi:glutamine tRNA-synthetase [Tupanvirus deep ocean]|uniref:Glutamine tRNA-synthetase n=2 Tax=Tupanvirus TaxID=2094720 RepID=A0AC62A7C9_9VIRU|nr:glutamine tRNA-synthetase [Tupanvirus deep ocean]QKU33533.1 glutamine tRNA-synthetase [Tupanvirus deep ocean]